MQAECSKRLYLVRGPSGSGKTTIADYIRRQFHVENPAECCDIRETDDFFIMPDGEYSFNRNWLKEAHNWNRMRVLRDFFSGRKCIIVSNTSCSAKECEPYLSLASQFDYKTSIIKTPKPWDVETLYFRNVHKVPRDVIRRQIERYEPIEGEEDWNEQT